VDVKFVWNFFEAALDVLFDVTLFSIPEILFQWQWAVELLKEKEKDGDYCAGVRGFFDVMMTWQVVDELSVKHSKKEGENGKDADFRKCFQNFPTFDLDDANFCAPMQHLDACRKAYEQLQDFLNEFKEHEKMRQDCKVEIESYTYLFRNTIDRKWCSCFLYVKFGRI
jgi:soluble cytochrome b562